MRYIRSIVYHLTESEALARQAASLADGQDCIARRSAGDSWILIEFSDKPVQHGQAPYSA